MVKMSMVWKKLLEPKYLSVVSWSGHDENWGLEIAQTKVLESYVIL